MSANDLDGMRESYQQAVEEWIGAIRHEQQLASVDHNLAKLDEWEQAAMLEDEARGRAKAAKRAYEDRLRQEIFHF